VVGEKNKLLIQYEIYKYVGHVLNNGPHLFVILFLFCFFVPVVVVAVAAAAAVSSTEENKTNSIWNMCMMFFTEPIRRPRRRPPNRQQCTRAIINFFCSLVRRKSRGDWCRSGRRKTTDPKTLRRRYSRPVNIAVARRQYPNYYANVVKRFDRK